MSESGSVHLSREEFGKLVEEAIQGLPQEFRDKLDNVVVTVKDTPGPQDLGKHRGGLLLGLYHGVPLIQRSPFAPIGPFPDRITIFQHSIERICRSREEIVAQVRRTVLHEIAHHFGFSEQHIRELGY